MSFWFLRQPPLSAACGQGHRLPVRAAGLGVVQRIRALFAQQAAPFGMLAAFVLFYILSWILFTGLTFLYRFFLVLLWYLGCCLYAAVLLLAFSALYDLPYPLPRVWREASGQGWFLFIYGGFELVAALALRQLLRRQDRLHLNPRQLVLYVAFPAASFVSLVAFLPMLSGRPVNQWLIGGCCVALLLANLAVLFLLRRMEQAPGSGKTGGAG